MYAYTVEAQKIGYNVLKTYNVIHLAPLYYYTDGLHPSTGGAVELGAAIAKAFNNEYVSAFRPTYGEYREVASNIARTANAQYRVTTVDDVTNINFNQFFFWSLNR